MKFDSTRWITRLLRNSAILATMSVVTLAHAANPPASASKIKHVIIIMQENRSFDSYFGTFPGANGIPAGTCVPLDPQNPQAGCVAPFHDPRDVNAGGPHTAEASQADLDDGIKTAKMDGFLKEQLSEDFVSYCKISHPHCELFGHLGRPSAA